jgi:CO/xanthine dehydrogenase FAD-binding subunit
LDFVQGQPLGEPLVEEVLRTVDAQISPFSDLRGSEWYKRRMARVFVRKAIDQVQQRAAHQR